MLLLLIAGIFFNLFIFHIRQNDRCYFLHRVAMAFNILAAAIDDVYTLKNGSQERRVIGLVLTCNIKGGAMVG